jgi:hypothetical protein
MHASHAAQSAGASATGQEHSPGANVVLHETPPVKHAPPTGQVYATLGKGENVAECSFGKASGGVKVKVTCRPLGGHAIADAGGEYTQSVGAHGYGAAGA